MAIRLRLALWYTGVLAFTLVVFGLLVYFVMSRHLIAESDDGITSRAHHIASTIRVTSSAGGGGLAAELPPIDAFESPSIHIQVLRPDGSLLARSDNLGSQEIPIDETAFDTAQDGRNVLYTAYVGGEQLRVYMLPLNAGGRIIGFVQVARSYGDVYAILDRLRLWLLVGGTASLMLAGGIGWAVASSALRPIASITNTARAIALSRGFSRRLEETGPRDEVGQLGITFNEMLASLEEAYAAQQRFIADASHELRTPLTAVRANLELLERQGRGLPPAEQTELVRAAASEAQRMSRLVAELLSLARADAGLKLSLRPVELDRLLMEVYGEARLLAGDVKVVIEDIDQVSVLGDPDRLKQLMLILIDNAIQYTPSGGQVTLSLSRADARARLEVCDTGVGISAEDLPHIFERFYRADKGRARAEAGSGLGLAIGRWIVEQHSGEISVTSGVGRGTTFEVHIPLAPSPTAVGQAGQ